MQSVARSTTKMLPLTDDDEKKIGEELSSFYRRTNQGDKKTKNYLNELLKEFSPYLRKKFKYEINLDSCACSNAYALPGGIVFVTEGILDTFKTESELISVIAHEIAHVELNHCIDAVKYEALSEKIFKSSVGKLADLSRRLFISHSFSQSQEDEADTYAFEFLKRSKYDPMGVANAFANLMNSSGTSTSNKSSPIRDYFRSHPPLEDRVKKFSALAKQWWKKNSSMKRYLGHENLKKRVTLSQRDFGKKEYRTGPIKSSEQPNFFTK